MRVTLQRYPRCFVCGHSEIVIWQGDCGCFVTKCLLCGVIGWCDCGEEVESHWDELEEKAEALT